jgi:signal transduction histidine kinase
VKLFQRTLGSFVGVLTLQALLTGAAISTIFGSMQTEDAARKISTEAANAYESFNAWKLAFWKEINELAEDPELALAVASSRGSPETDNAVLSSLGRRQSSSAAAAMILRDNSTGASRYLGADSFLSGLPESASFYFMKAHPYVEIVSSRGSLWFVGAVRVAPGARRPLDLFILKRIDADLLGHLSYDPMVVIAALVPESGPKSAGAYSGAAWGQGASSSALSFVRDSRLPWAVVTEGEAYEYYPRLSAPEGLYSAVVRLIGSVSVPGGEKPVLLAAVLSLADYQVRAARLMRSVVAVSFVIMALIIVVALLLSQSIVSPIRRLSLAMRRIEGGDFRAELGGSVSGELGELLEGFNGMARKLAADKTELDEYIAEIVGLKERSDGIIESIREGLAVIDPEGRVESANGSFRSLFGEAAGVPLSRIVDIDRGPFDEALLDTVRDALRDRESRSGISRRAVDGRSFEIKLYPLVAATRPKQARCVVIVEDASARLAYEERVIQADKLASIGMLSAGIAHEINNPLSSILANVGNAISESSDAEAVASLRVVESETLRIARIVRQLLDFSSPRQQDGSADDARPRCDANAAVRELVRLVGYPLRAEGRVEFAELLDPDCRDAAISEDELKQVLLNLLKNALHAVGESGRIRVETRTIKGGMEISVADDGPGIPDAILKRIFDPFFTTKAGDGGAGIGLGLSVAYGIVTKRGGSIRAANEAGGGALFVVSLPEADGGWLK